jgi:hypothetical protein
MSPLVIPDHASRSFEADLRVLAKRVLEDLMSFDDSKLSPHIVGHVDLLSLYVQAALGVTSRINWGTATDEEVARMGIWQDYCCKLFGGVKPFILSNLSSGDPV